MKDRVISDAGQVCRRHCGANDIRWMYTLAKNLAELQQAYTGVGGQTMPCSGGNQDVTDSLAIRHIRAIFLHTGDPAKSPYIKPTVDLLMRTGDKSRHNIWHPNFSGTNTVLLIYDDDAQEMWAQ